MNDNMLYEALALGYLREAEKKGSYEYNQANKSAKAQIGTSQKEHSKRSGLAALVGAGAGAIAGHAHAGALGAVAGGIGGLAAGSLGGSLAKEYLIRRNHRIGKKARVKGEFAEEE